MKFLSNEQKGILYSVLSGICYGLIGYFGISALNNDMSISNMLCWRFFISSIFMAILLIPNLKANVFIFKELFAVFLYGSLLYSFGSIVYFQSCQKIGTGLATVIFFIFPTIVILLNWLFYREKIHRIHYISILLIFIGLLLILIKPADLNFNITGIGLGIFSATLYAAYIIFSKKIQAIPTVATFMLSLGSALTCGIIAIVTDTFYIPTQLNSWFYILGIGIICTALPILFFLKSMETISASQASLLSASEPTFTVLFGVCLLHEKINILQILGAIIVLIGAFATFLLPFFKKIWHTK